MKTNSQNSNHPTNYVEIDPRNNPVPSELRKSADKKGLASLIIGIILLFFLTFGQILYPFRDYSIISSAPNSNLCF